MKTIFLKYKPKYKKGHTRDWLTEWPRDRQTETHQKWIYFTSKYFVFYKIFCKLYFWSISQNINKVIPVTDWPSEWQMENTPNLKIFNTKFYNLYFGWFMGEINVSELICEWLRGKHVHRGPAALKRNEKHSLLLNWFF